MNEHYLSAIDKNCVEFYSQKLSLGGITMNVIFILHEHTSQHRNNKCINSGAT